MALQKFNIGTNEDGSPRFHFVHDGDPDEAVVYTGPNIGGSVTVSDGTVYDLSEHVTVVRKGHEGEVSHHVGLRFESEGHPLHLEAGGEPFLHHCTAACGEQARPVVDPFAAFAAARAQQQTDAIVDADVRAHHAAALGTGSAGGPSMARAGVAAENAALNGLDGTGSTNVIPDTSLHTADCGTTGASENANTGSYARQAASWNAAASGAKTNSAGQTFSTAGTTAVSYFGTWSSATYGAGNFAIGGALASSVTAASITIASGAISLGAS
ncbi:MAG: phage tail fiber protein [Jatrophihabitans sp.]|uniref:phage tail fiber protein n=1 Tax=Jatrophihabitans sp. TaxID=1932789 RepID=UPI003F7E6E88